MGFVLSSTHFGLWISLFLFKAHAILQFIDRYSSFRVHCRYFACIALRSCNAVNVRINFITYILLMF